MRLSTRLWPKALFSEALRGLLIFMISIVPLARDARLLFRNTHSLF